MTKQNYSITTFLPLAHFLLATRKAQASPAHLRLIAKNFAYSK